MLTVTAMGDLAVNWKYDESDADGYVESTMLLMRNTGSDDNVTQTMGQFYWDNCFTATLVQILLDAGFSTSVRMYVLVNGACKTRDVQAMTLI